MKLFHKIFLCFVLLFGLDYQNVVLGDNALAGYASRELFHDRYVVITYEILTE